MRWDVEHRMRSLPAEVVATLHDTASWASWAPGVRRVVSHGDEVEVEVQAGVPWQLRVAAVRHEHGLDVALVRGPLPDVAVSVRMQGAVAHLGVVLVPPASVPAPLLRELERHVLPEALRRLDEATASRPADAPGRTARPGD